METISKVDELRAIIADEQVSITERRAVAAHLIRLTVESVSQPSSDDIEVIELMTPWEDHVLAAQWSEATNGRSANGCTQTRALEIVYRRHRLRAVLAVVVSEAAHRLERLAAVETVLNDFMHPQGHYHRNAFTSEKLLETVKPATAVKWTVRGKEPVARPPVGFADVWD
jgi:hypothetical protein